MANPIVEYKLPQTSTWKICICAAGETLEECRASLERMWPGSETRQFIALCDHGVDFWEACTKCGRVAPQKDKILGQ